MSDSNSTFDKLKNYKTLKDYEKSKSKKDILAQFINDAKDQNFHKLATIKTLQKVERDKFDKALMN